MSQRLEMVSLGYLRYSDTGGRRGGSTRGQDLLRSDHVNQECRRTWYKDYVETHGSDEIVPFCSRNLRKGLH